MKADAKKVVKSLKKNGFNLSGAARDLGMTPQAVTKRAKKDPLIKSALNSYLGELRKAGATDQKSARVISEAMDAKAKRGVGHGEDFTIVEEDDHYARLKANDQYLKIKRLLEPEEKGNAPVNISVTVEIADENTPSQEPGNRISQYIQV